MKVYVQAESLKYRHTVLKTLAVLMPAVTVLFSAWLTYGYFAVDSYNWWYTGFGAGMLGIVCGIIGGKDKRKKNFTIYSLPCKMEKIWDAKILTAAALSAAAVVCIIVLTIVVSRGMEHMMQVSFHINPSIKAQMAAGLLIWLITLWQIPFCLLLSQKTGPFVMFMIHMTSCLVQTSIFSLKPWFAVFPGAITSRLMCPLLGVLPNGLPAVEGQMTYSPQLMGMDNFLIGIPTALFWFAALWILGRKWFGRQVMLS